MYSSIQKQLMSLINSPWNCLRDVQTFALAFAVPYESRILWGERFFFLFNSVEETPNLCSAIYGCTYDTFMPLGIRCLLLTWPIPHILSQMVYTSAYRGKPRRVPSVCVDAVVRDPCFIGVAKWHPLWRKLTPLCFPPRQGLIPVVRITATQRWFSISCHGKHICFISMASCTHSKCLVSERISLKGFWKFSMPGVVSSVFKQTRKENSEEGRKVSVIYSIKLTSWGQIRVEGVAVLLSISAL